MAVSRYRFYHCLLCFINYELSDSSSSKWYSWVSPKTSGVFFFSNDKSRAPHYDTTVAFFSLPLQPRARKIVAFETILMQKSTSQRETILGFQPSSRNHTRVHANFTLAPPQTQQKETSSWKRSGRCHDISGEGGEDEAELHMVKRSEDPFEDFKRLIMEKQMLEETNLEQFLQGFLSLNSKG
ncbi:hypothetical protein L2E82_45214 [Cichorium intybus]|uniref:Uncharacterized protein n=1 Tax=Cichorium intybus TaxID=13427 RepID=A0ACB8ZS94_CICIN|nr:hypothetical protein L2E82_45214 [Cichorium intybus]